MTKRRNILKVVAAFSALLVLMLSVTIANGGRWRGSDPVVYVNGEKLNIWVEWPTEMTCEIGAINVTVMVPVIGDVEFIGESEDKFKCTDSNEKVVIRTNTTVQRSLVETTNIIGEFEAASNDADFGFDLDDGSLDVSLSASGEIKVFPVRMKIYKDGELIRTCEGYSNLPVECVPTFTSQVGLLNDLF